MEEEAVINVRELLDTLHKLFRACEVAGFDYTRQVMGDTVQSVGALVHKAASEPQESVDKQITVVATNSLKVREVQSHVPMHRIDADVFVFVCCIAVSRATDECVSCCSLWKRGS